MEYNLFGAIVSFILMAMTIFVTVKAHFNRTTKLEQRIFLNLAYSAILLELLQGFDFLNTGRYLLLSTTLLYILNALQLFFFVFASYSWLEYLMMKLNCYPLNTRVDKIINLIPIIMMIVLCIISYWTGWIFSVEMVDGLAVYQRGPYFVLQLVLPYVYEIMGIVLVIYYLAKKPNKKIVRNTKYFFFFAVPSVIATILQIVFGGGFTPIGVSICAIFLYIEMYSEDIKENRRLKEVDAVNEQLKIINQKLETQTSTTRALADIYFAAYAIDTQTGSFMKIKTPEYSSSWFKDCHGPFQIMDSFISNGVDEESVPQMKEFLNLKTIEQRLQGKVYLSCEYKGKTGLVPYCRASWVVVSRGEKGNVTKMLFVVEDITEEVTERKRMEEQLKLALSEAEKANRAKSTFLSRMSHDIRTPLNGIIGLIEIDEKHADDLPLITENRKKAKVAANHLLSLISDVLALSKMDDSNVTLAHEPFNIIELATDVLTISGMRAMDSGITIIHADCTPHFIYPYVYGSPLHVRQILLNIFSNCIKYNKPNGSITCKADLVSHDDKIVTYRVTISDTGIGMSEEFLKHVFEPFCQEHTDARSTYQGTGLGMAIVKSILDKLGGTIEIKSQLNVGSTFIITIPFEIATEADMPKKAETKEISLEGMKVLLVEDNELNMEIAKTILEDFHVKVTCASNGQIAYETFKGYPEGSFDCILMDLMMPVLDGYGATKAIRAYEREDSKTIPIIAVTANAFAEDAKACLDAGMNGHISKPIDVSQLIHVLSGIKTKES